MTDIYNNDYYEDEDFSKTDTEDVTENTIIEESAETAKPKKSGKRKTAAAPKAKKTGADRLAALKEQREKLTVQRTDNRKKGKDIDNQLADINDKIRKAEISNLEKVCAERNITIPDLTDFLENLPNGKKLSYSDSGDLPPAPEKVNGNGNG